MYIDLLFQYCLNSDECKMQSSLFAVDRSINRRSIFIILSNPCAAAQQKFEIMSISLYHHCSMIDLIKNKALYAISFDNPSSIHMFPFATLEKGTDSLQAALSNISSSKQQFCNHLPIHIAHSLCVYTMFVQLFLYHNANTSNKDPLISPFLINSI